MIIVGLEKMEKVPVLDRLAELGRQGIYWSLNMEPAKIMWNLLADNFPGLAPLVSLGLGIDPGRKACALVKFASIKKENGEIYVIKEEKLKENFVIEIGENRVELINKGGYSLVFYDGSERIKENYTKTGKINRVEALDKGAKMSAKLLRTFSQRIFERTGKYAMFYGFGKLRKARRIKGCIYAESAEMRGLGKALGMKIVNKGKIFKEKGLKIMHLTGNIGKELIPLLTKSEEEVITIIGLEKKVYNGIILVGPGIRADSAREFLEEAAGLGSLSIEMLKRIITIFREKEQEEHML